MKKFSFLIFFSFFQFIDCKKNAIDDVKTIEGLWEIYSVSSGEEVFYLKGKS